VLLLILIKFIVKKGKSVVDRDIDSIVFCPSELPYNIVDEFKKIKSDKDCETFGMYQNDNGQLCKRFRQC